MTIDHWLEGRLRSRTGVVADLVRRQVVVIASLGNVSATLAAKAATATIPIVFSVPDDPVRLGLVASLAQPGGNATGINFFTEVVAKRLRLLHDRCPKSFAIPCSSIRRMLGRRMTLRDLQESARTIGLQIQILNASTIGEIDAAFASLARERPDALFVAPVAFFTSRRVQFVTLTAVNKIPAAYSNRDFVAGGGLMSYGTDIADAFPSSRRLHRYHPQGREACRSASAAVDKIRVRHQPSNGASTWHRGAARVALYRRRGDQ